MIDWFHWVPLTPSAGGRRSLHQYSSPCPTTTTSYLYSCRHSYSSLDTQSRLESFVCISGDHCLRWRGGGVPRQTPPLTTFFPCVHRCDCTGTTSTSTVHFLISFSHPKWESNWKQFDHHHYHANSLFGAFAFGQKTLTHWVWCPPKDLGTLLEIKVVSLNLNLSIKLIFWYW